MRIPFFPRKSSPIRVLDILDEYGEAALMGVTDGAPLHLQPRKTYELAERNLDLGKTINNISAAISALKIGIVSEADDETIDYNAPLVQLLNRPGDGSSRAQFWKNGAESFLLTNEFWLIARGSVNRPPLALAVVRPYEVRVELSPVDGLPLWIRTESNRDRRIYKREESGGRIRYIDAAGLNEICPIIGLTSIVDNWRGRSPLAKLYYDLKMSTDGKRHNTSLLKNGMRTTGILSPTGAKPNGEMWPVEAVKKLGDKLRTFNQGAGNAGNIVVSSIPMKVDGLAQNNRDMDFLNLLKLSRESIYNLYSYPLPLVLSDTMTLDNYTVAQQAFYTEAVIPVFDEIASGIIMALGSRYGLTGAVKIVCSTQHIHALQGARYAAMESLKNSEVVSVNEIRAVGGFEADPSGDVILVSGQKMPLDVVAGPVTFNDTPPPADDEEGDE